MRFPLPSQPREQMNLRPAATAESKWLVRGAPRAFKLTPPTRSQGESCDDDRRRSSGPKAEPGGLAGSLVRVTWRSKVV